VSLSFDGDVVVVTGGAGGLGSAYCRLLALRGARVVVNDTGGVIDGRSGDPGTADCLAAELVARGGQAAGCSYDGSTVEGARQIVQTALSRFGRIDAVIANAGILRDRTFVKVSDQDFFAVLTAHLAGTVRIFHAAMPSMHEQGNGRLVATTSSAGLFGNFGQTAYAAAKMGIVGLMQSLAIEGARRNIYANVVCPVAETRMSQGLMGPLDGKASPDLVAPIVAYLASQECHVSGRIYSAGAGRVARVRVGVTRGLTTAEMSPEWITENLAEIDAELDHVFPATIADEMSLFI
jgi:NAD(P)-dependent dehydrogenase (short-subunit alcohol dehydrogenase family)